MLPSASAEGLWEEADLLLHRGCACVSQVRTWHVGWCPTLESTRLDPFTTAMMKYPQRWGRKERTGLTVPFATTPLARSKKSLHPHVYTSLYLSTCTCVRDIQHLYSLQASASTFLSIGVLFLAFVLAPGSTELLEKGDGWVAFCFPGC